MTTIRLFWRLTRETLAYLHPERMAAAFDALAARVDRHTGRRP